MKRNIKCALYFGGVGIIAYVTAIPYIVAVSEQTIEGLNKAEGTSITLAQYILGSGFNFFLMTVILSFIGASLAPKVGLRWDWIRAVFERKDKPEWDRTYLRFAVLWGITAAILIASLTSFVFAPQLPQLAEANQHIDIPWWAGLTTIFQGGISEEVMMRFGLMTLLVWLLSKVFARKGGLIPPWIYWAAIVGAAVLFGAGHLPVAQSVYGGLSPGLVTYIILGNGIGGLGFGYLYWKKGLEYAILSHMTADFMHHFFMPLIASFFA